MWRKHSALSAEVVNRDLEVCSSFGTLHPGPKDVGTSWLWIKSLSACACACVCITNDNQFPVIDLKQK